MGSNRAGSMDGGRVNQRWHRRWPGIALAVLAGLATPILAIATNIITSTSIPPIFRPVRAWAWPAFAILVLLLVGITVAETTRRRKNDQPLAGGNQAALTGRRPADGGPSGGRTSGGSAGAGQPESGPTGNGLTGNRLIGSQITGSVISGQATGPVLTGSQITGPAVTAGQITGSAVGGGQVTRPAVAGGEVTGSAVVGGNVSGDVITNSVPGIYFDNSTVTIGERTSASTPADRPSAEPVPSMLPADIPDFIGRHDELSNVCQMLGSPAAGQSAAVTVSALPGCPEAVIRCWPYISLIPCTTSSPTASSMLICAGPTGSQ